MWTALVLAALLKAAASASASAATAARHFPSAQLPALSPSMTNKSNIFSNCLIGEMSPHLSPLLFSSTFYVAQIYYHKSSMFVRLPLS